jgi:hypothetical protein
MIEIKMMDIYGTKIHINESRSGYFRIDFKGEQFIEKDDGLGNKIPCCISLSKDEARILQSALNIYFEEDN